MMAPPNKAHQYRYSQAFREANTHISHMHDSLKPMFKSLPVDWALQWKEGDKPIYNVEPLINPAGLNMNILHGLVGNGVKIFDMDKRNVRLLQEHGADAEWRPVLLTSSMLDWVGKLDSHRPIDVLNIGNNEGRREPYIEALHKRFGIHFRDINGIYGSAATDLMKQAKVVVNIHRESELQAQEQLRIMWAIACGCVVVSETSLEPSIPDGIIVESPVDNFTNAVHRAVFNWNYADALRRRTDYLALSMEYMMDPWGLA